MPDDNSNTNRPSMIYVIAKNKKTGSEQIFTEPVFRANEAKGWKFVAYTENPNAKKKEATPAPAAAPKVEAKKVETKVEKKSNEGDVANSVLTDLQTQYKAATGKEPNKKWGVPKLTEEIKKLETATA